MQLEFLRTVAFLKPLSDVELAAFQERLLVRLILPGKKILQEGEPVQALYIVVKGSVEVRKATAKSDVLIAKIGEGSFFGEINLFDSGEATASVFSLDNVSLASIPFTSLRTFFYEYPLAGVKILSCLLAEASKRLRSTNERLASSVLWWSSGVPFALPKPPQAPVSEETA